MHLGAAVEPFPALDGFGLRTADRGLLHADSRVGINSSGGDVRVQAQSDSGRVLTISGGNSVFAAKGSSYLVGDGYPPRTVDAAGLSASRRRAPRPTARRTPRA